MTTEQVAEQIVDGILDAVERAGYFMGAALMLKDIVDRETGTVTSERTRVVRWTADMLRIIDRI